MGAISLAAYGYVALCFAGWLLAVGGTAWIAGRVLREMRIHKASEPERAERQAAFDQLRAEKRAAYKSWALPQRRR